MTKDRAVSIDEVYGALDALRGPGASATTVGDSSVLLQVLRARGAVEAVEILQAYSSELDVTPQIRAAQVSLALVEGSRHLLRNQRISMVRKELAISMRSFYRYELAGIKAFAHYLIDKNLDREPAEGPSREYHSPPAVRPRGDISLEMIYDMVLSVTETNQAIRNELNQVKDELLAFKEEVNVVVQRGGDGLSGMNPRSFADQKFNRLQESVIETQDLMRSLHRLFIEDLMTKEPSEKVGSKTSNKSLSAQD